MKKRRIIYISLALIVVVALFLTLRDTDEVPVFESVVVERGAVSHVVSVTGHAEPISRVSLSFPMGGTIAMLPVEEGAYVEKNTTVAQLNTGVLQASLNEAHARVSREQAVLHDLLSPLRSEERAVEDATVAGAETSMLRAEESARSALARVFVSVDDAIHEEVDELFDGGKGPDPDFGITFVYGSTRYFIQADPQTESTLNTQRKTIEDILQAMKDRSHTTGPITDALFATSQDIDFVDEFLNIIAGVINKYIADDTEHQLVYETFQTSIATACTAVSAARSEIVLAQKEYSAAETALSLALRHFELSLAGASGEAVVTQEAMVAIARTAVDAAAERISDATLRAPFAGRVSRVEPQTGEAIAPYQPVIELLTEGTYEVEAYIPEADIAQVKLGDRTTITFDAFERTDVFDAEVVRIALSETVREGVPTYKTTFMLSEPIEGPRILRPGMTADVDIHTDTRSNVLYLPVRSVLREGNRTYVRIFDDSEFVERDIKTGLRGSDGSIEIVSGLSEGDEVVLYVEES